MSTSKGSRKGGAVLSFRESQTDAKNAMSALEQIETGNFATPSWMIFRQDSVRVVSWNIKRGLHPARVIQFLTGAKRAILLLYETDPKSLRAHKGSLGRYTLE